MSAMPALRAHTLLVGGDDRPPVILVHGAANSGHVWTFWRDELARRGWSSHAIDLRDHGTSAAADLAITRMADYVDDVIAFARTLRQAPVLVGWSMGGLVALIAAMRARLASSSPPPVPDAGRHWHGRQAVAQAAVRRSSVLGRSLRD
jgi:pimeloyl-ACP methyl ester carboxylesterase